MKLGLVTYNLAKDWDIETIINRCIKTGFEGVELRTTHAHGVEVSLNAAERTEVKAKFSDSPVALCGLGSAFEYHSTDAQELRENVEGTKAYAQLAADVGAPGIKVRPNRLHDDVPEDETLSQIAEACRECALFAAEVGVAIRLEVHGKETSNPEKIGRILDQADHPSFSACWNSNQNEVVDGSIDAAFEQLSGRIGLVHMRDLCLPDYPWAHLIQRLRASAFAGFCCAEIPANEDPERIMQYYSALWRAYVEHA